MGVIRGWERSGMSYGVREPGQLIWRGGDLGMEGPLPRTGKSKE